MDIPQFLITILLVEVGNVLKSRDIVVIVLQGIPVSHIRVFKLVNSPLGSGIVVRLALSMGSVVLKMERRIERVTGPPTAALRKRGVDEARPF